MVKSAQELWLQLNSDRYRCDECGFVSPNHAHWYRHVRSDKHFLLSVFAEEAPRDIKLLVASFLPFVKLTSLGRLGLQAVNLAVGPRVRWITRNVIQVGDPEDPPFRTVYLGVHSGNNLRSLAYVL
jgi:hypothetical protein